MFVVFLYGRPATGKFTVGKIVAEKLGIPLFHNHLTVDLVSSLFDFGTPEFIEMRQRIWLDAFEASAKAGQSFVFTFNPENTVRQVTIDRMRFAIEGNGGQILFVEFLCDEREIEKRLGDESRGEFGKLTDVEQYRELSAAGVFDSPFMPETTVRIETSDLSAVEAAEIIVAAVNQAIQ